MRSILSYLSSPRPLGCGTTPDPLKSRKVRSWKADLAAAYTLASFVTIALAIGVPRVHPFNKTKRKLNVFSAPKLALFVKCHFSEVYSNPPGNLSPAPVP